MTTAIRSAAFGLLLVLVLAPETPAAQQQPGGDVFDAFFRFGDTAHKVYAQEAPGETVDPFTGTLRVVQEDLALPGKGGLDLRVVRTYSSKIWSRSDLLDVSPLLAESAGSVLGYGWSFHMGRLRNPYAIVPVFACGAGEFPVFEGPDGETRVFYPVNDDVANRVYRSKDRWRLEVNCKALGGDNSGACVWSSSGIRYELSNAPGNPFWEGTRPVWPVTAIVDPNDNRIAVSYVPSTGAVASITDTYSRVVDFSYTRREDGLRLETMTANGKTFTYSYIEVTSSETTGPGRIAIPGMRRRFLTEVRPPRRRPVPVRLRLRGDGRAESVRADERSSIRTAARPSTVTRAGLSSRDERRSGFRSYRAERFPVAVCPPGPGRTPTPRPRRSVG